MFRNKDTKGHLEGDKRTLLLQDNRNLRSINNIYLLHSLHVQLPSL